MKIVKYSSAQGTQAEYGIITDGIIRPILKAKSLEDVHNLMDGGAMPAIGEALALEDVRILPPAGDHPHIYCAGLNYRDHALEVRMPFLKYRQTFPEVGNIV